MSPTFEFPRSFDREFRKLSRKDQKAFRDAVQVLVEALQGSGRSELPPRLRIKGVQGHPGVFEMTFAPDGRATFSYGDEIKPEEAHIVWRRIGSHDIFKRP